MRASIPNLPTNTELILYLLKEELKMTHFFNSLHNLGLQNDSDYQLDLSPLVFACMGLDDSDETLERYVFLIDKHSKDLPPGRAALLERTLACYGELLLLKAPEDASK